MLEQQFRYAADFLEHGEQWLPGWQDAATFSDFRLRLDPAALQTLNEELFAVIERYRATPPPDGAETVFVQIQSFPRAGGPA